MAEWEHPHHLYQATEPISHLPSVRDVVIRGREKGVYSAHKTKGMLKSPGLTVEITDSRVGPGNVRLQQVLEQPLPHAPVGHGLGFPFLGALRRRAVHATAFKGDTS